MDQVGKLTYTERGLPGLQVPEIIVQDGAGPLMCVLVCECMVVDWGYMAKKSVHFIERKIKDG